jgi:hypothetical protein
MKLSIRESERTKDRIGWLVAYREYLESALWRDKKAKVMLRCKRICEGCGNRRAVEVHHVRYPAWPCMPGSEEWKRLEKLYDLVGLCEACHEDVYGGKWEMMG